MATDQAAQWAEPSGRDSMASIAESTLNAAATAVQRAGIGITARRVTARVAARARGVTIRARGVTARAGGWALRVARNSSAATARTLRRLPRLTLRQAYVDYKQSSATEPGLAPAAPWLAAAVAAWPVYLWTSSGPHAAIAGTCVFALSTLNTMRSAQRREALAIREQLAELRLSLRVTQALLDVEMVDGAEHLDDELDDARESGTRRLPRQRVSRPQLG